MTTHPQAVHAIIPREKLDFGFDQDIPKYWFGGDPYKSRFWDALSVIFPPGEKFFMTTVRDFRDRVTDPKLLQDIKDFNRQEAQHTLVHNQYNDHLRRQGIDVDGLIAELDTLMNKQYRARFSREYTLAMTAALEHFTALGAHTLFDDRDLMKVAHPNVRAMYAWHAIEEVEHKGVAYDVMIDVAKVGYFKRIGALLHASVMFPLTIRRFTEAMLKADGFSWWQRRWLMVKGTWWVLKPGGVAWPIWTHYLSYLKPSYHPWQETDQPGYAPWLKAFNMNRDPVEASEMMRASLVR
jgi:predicted metal-dependent hydrolase